MKNLLTLPRLFSSLFKGGALLICIAVFTSSVPLAANTEDLVSILPSALYALFSGAVGGGVVALAFKGLVDNALKKSDTLKLLVMESVGSHSTVTGIQTQLNEVKANVSTINTDIKAKAQENVDVAKQLAKISAQMEHVMTAIERLESKI